MYDVGQQVVHPMHGAGVIESITEELLSGAARTYYVFRQTVGGLTLKLPVDNCDAIGVRPLSDPEHISAVMAAIPTISVEEERNWNRRYRENMARLKSGDLIAVAQVIKSLMLRDAEKGLSTGERKMLHSAKEILLSEVAMVCRWAYDEAERRLNSIIMTGACE